MKKLILSFTFGAVMMLNAPGVSNAQSPEVEQEIEDLLGTLEGILESQQSKEWSCQQVAAAATTYFWLRSTLRLSYTDEVKNGVYEIFSLRRVLSALSDQGSPVTEDMLDQIIRAPIEMEPQLENIEQAYTHINVFCSENL